MYKPTPRRRNTVVVLKDEFARLNRERDEARAEHSALLAKYKALFHVYGVLLSQANSLTDKITQERDEARAQLAEANRIIKFYADRNGPGEDSDFCLLEGKWSEVNEDGYTDPFGTRARAFLEKFGGQKQ